jgi:hypothetical protein
MNNTWEGHETSVYDRQDLVMDLQQLLSQSRTGNINEWVPVLGQTNETISEADAEDSEVSN